jgi:hypothetical protein
MEFMERGQQVHLQGIQSKKLAISEMSTEQYRKWEIGNNIWALAVRHPTELPSKESAPPMIILQVLTEFEDVFADAFELPPHRQYEHTIPLLPGTHPVNTKPYRYSPLHKDEIEKQVKSLLQAGLISPSTSPFASPMLLVQKKDGTWCFCVDYRRLNSVTVKNKFPMPLIEEMLDELTGARYFTKLDFKADFHQVRMDPTDEFKTAFKTHYGHYQFKVMPFGLTNTPATFQCIMNSILEPFLRKFVIVFMDDILIYSSTLQDHAQHIKGVLQLLREHKFYVKLSKCEFAKEELEYLGHTISDAGMDTYPKKTQAVLDWPIPTNVTELRGFLGVTGYYRKFIHHYGSLAKPLTNLLRKKQFQRSAEAHSAFETLK